MINLSGIVKAISGLFGGNKTTVVAPAPVEIPAPAVQAPQEAPEKVLESDLAQNRKRKKGKASLMIERDSGGMSSTGSTGLNL